MSVLSLESVPSCLLCVVCGMKVPPPPHNTSQHAVLQYPLAQCVPDAHPPLSPPLARFDAGAGAGAGSSTATSSFTDYIEHFQHSDDMLDEPQQQRERERDDEEAHEQLLHPHRGGGGGGGGGISSYYGMEDWSWGKLLKDIWKVGTYRCFGRGVQRVLWGSAELLLTGATIGSCFGCSTP